MNQKPPSAMPAPSGATPENVDATELHTAERHFHQLATAEQIFEVRC
jgi:hypothetical protein